MGVVLEDPSDMKFVGKKYYEDEVVSVWSYVFYLKYEGAIVLNDGEVEYVEYWTKDEIEEKMNTLSDRITKDSIDSYKYLISEYKF